MALPFLNFASLPVTGNPTASQVPDKILEGLKAALVSRLERESLKKAQMENEYYPKVEESKLAHDQAVTQEYNLKNQYYPQITQADLADKLSKTQYQNLESQYYPDKIKATIEELNRRKEEFTDPDRKEQLYFNSLPVGLKYQYVIDHPEFAQKNFRNSQENALSLEQIKALRESGIGKSGTYEENKNILNPLPLPFSKEKEEQRERIAQFAKEMVNRQATTSQQRNKGSAARVFRDTLDEEMADIQDKALRASKYVGLGKARRITDGILVFLGKASPETEKNYGAYQEFEHSISNLLQAVNTSIEGASVTPSAQREMKGMMSKAYDQAMSNPRLANTYFNDAMRRVEKISKKRIEEAHPVYQEKSIYKDSKKEMENEVINEDIANYY